MAERLCKSKLLVRLSLSFLLEQCLNRMDDPCIALGHQGYNCRSDIFAISSITLEEGVVNSGNNEAWSRCDTRTAASTLCVETQQDDGQAGYDIRSETQGQDMRKELVAE